MNMEEFLGMQNELQIQMRLVNRELEGSPFYMTTNEQMLSFLRWNHTALIIELSEAMEETGWKPWASSRHMNYEAFIKEMVDGWHFFMNMLLVAAAIEGKTIAEVADDFTEQYVTKNAKNLQRQMEGYDGVSTKCAYCHRELSDVEPGERWMNADGNRFCSLEHHDLYYQEGARRMTEASDRELSELQADIEQRSSQRPGSGTPQDLQDAAAAAHRAKQGATVDLSGAPTSFEGPLHQPEPRESGDLPDLGDVDMDDAIESIKERQVARSKNPHAMKMVIEAEGTGEPLFCFRARDFFSIQVIAFYARIVEEYGPDDAAFHNNIVDALGEFKEWQKDHITEVRYPD